MYRLPFFAGIADLYSFQSSGEHHHKGTMTKVTIKSITGR